MGHAERLSIAGAGENHVLHAGAAEALGALLAEDPADGIAEVRFSAAVRADDGGDAGTVESHVGAVVKRLEALDIDAFKFEHGSPFSLDVHSGGVTPS